MKFIIKHASFDRKVENTLKDRQIEDVKVVQKRKYHDGSVRQESERNAKAVEVDSLEDLLSMMKNLQDTWSVATGDPAIILEIPNITSGRIQEFEPEIDGIITIYDYYVE